MRRIMPHTLQAKFLAGQGLVMALMVGFFALTLNLYLERLMEGEARAKAALILSQVEAVQGYVRATLRPAMYRLLPEDQFVLEAMSTSYVTRGIMSDQNLAKEAFTYRRVGVGARNPDYEADERERGLIARFEADPAVVRLEEFVEIDGEQQFVTARPQRFEAACLRCHGDPAEAPRELIERYGSSRGFGREVGQLAGMDLVRLKVQRDVGGIHDATLSFALLFAAGILVLFLVIQGFFHRLVVQSLRRVTGVMRRLFPEEAKEAAALPSGEDEIEDILHGFEAFAQHLRQARLDLTDYATTLEDRVAVRTGAITRLADDRRADVALFVALLNSLNESQNKSQMLAAALALTAQRFGASRAGYVCVLGASDYASWPEPGAAPDLPDDWHDLVASGDPRLTSRAWYIPVQTSGTSRGLLCLHWDARQEKSVRLTDLARAIGQQLGIAMENLDALDSLLRQNDLLSSIFEGIADPLLLLDTGGAVLLANTTARNLALAVGPDARRGEPVPGGQGFDGLRDLLDQATGNGGRGEFELADGRIFEASLYPMPQPGGGLRHVASLREVTAERRMEGQMRRNERIVAVGQLAAGLAHEINNPLGVIRCYAELLQASQQEPQAQADLEVIMRHTEQARRVVRDLLDFARPRPAEPGPSDLAAVAASTLEVLKPRGRNNMSALTLEAEPGLPQVAAGAEALEHILTNLAMNALDAVSGRSEGGQVLVSLRAHGEMVELRVSDNGPGIAPEHLDRVFDPFFTTKEVGKGTGLGLAVVYSLVRDLDGGIEVENAPEGGARFRVLLPAAHATPTTLDFS